MRKYHPGYTRKDGLYIPPRRSPKEDAAHDDIARRNQEAADRDSKTKKKEYPMKITLGWLVRGKREILGLSRPQLARKLRITKEFLGHVENDAPVHLSDRLANRLVAQLSIGPARMTALKKKWDARRNRWKRANRKSLKRKH